MNKETVAMLTRLNSAGISWDDALALRRISMTLHRWHELECGDGNDYASWAIERDEETDIPYMVRHYHGPGMGAMPSSKTPVRDRIPDREKGAHKRLAAIMQKYPSLIAYVQTDPRGASLYILKRSDLEGNRIVEEAQRLGFTYEKAGRCKSGAMLYESKQVKDFVFFCPEEGALRFFRTKDIEPPASRNLPIDEYYSRGIAVYK